MSEFQQGMILRNDLNDAVMFLAKKYCHKHGVDK